MGIQGLLTNIQPALIARHVSHFRGKRVAIDGYMWLHKGVYGCSKDIAMGNENNTWINYCLKFIDMLLSNGLVVVMVFDGANLPSKEATESVRAAKRQKSKDRAIELTTSGDSKGAHSHFTSSVDITPLMAAKLIQVLKNHRPTVEYLVAPREADAQLAYLSLNGHIDIVIAEDSDTIPYACKEVIYKLDIVGNCQHLVLEHLFSNPMPAFDLTSFDQDMLVMTCVLSGCDYLDSLKGFGIKNSHKLVAKHRMMGKVMRQLRLQGVIPLVLATTTVSPTSASSDSITAKSVTGGIQTLATTSGKGTNNSSADDSTAYMTTSESQDDTKPLTGDTSNKGIKRASVDYDSNGDKQGATVLMPAMYMLSEEAFVKCDSLLQYVYSFYQVYILSLCCIFIFTCVCHCIHYIISCRLWRPSSIRPCTI